MRYPKPSSANRPPNEPVNTLTGKIWSPNLIPTYVEATRCSARKRTICTNFGILGSKSLISDEDTDVPITAHRCSRMKATEAYKGTPLWTVKQGVWRTNESLVVNYEYCCKDVCTSVENAMIQTGKITSYDGRIISSNLGDVSPCKAEAGSCTMEDGSVIIWVAKDLKPPCPYVTDRRDFSIERLGSYFLVEQAQQAFTRIKKRPIPRDPCLPQFAIMTDQGFILHFHDRQTFQLAAPDLTPLSRRLRAVKPKIPESNIDQEINIRLQYLEGHIRHWEEIRFKHIWMQICRLADNQLQIVKQLMKLDTTLAARIWLKRTDIAARVAGEALLVWPCAQVNSDFVFWNHRVGTDCYALLPVVINETMYFAIPGSKDLIRSGPKIPCFEAPIGVRYDENSHTWMSQKGQVDVKPLIQNFSQQVDRGLPIQLDAPISLHENEDIPPFQSSLELNMLETWRLKQQLNHLINATSKIHIEPEKVRRTLREIGDGTKDVNGLGIFRIKHIVTGLVSDAENVYSFFSTGFMRYLSDILMWALIAGTVFILIYLSIYCGGFCTCIECLGGTCWQIFRCFCQCCGNICTKAVRNRRNETEAPQTQQRRESTIELRRRPRQPIYTLTDQDTPTIYSEPIMWLPFEEHAKYQALIDTGAALTLMDKRVWDDLNANRIYKTRKCKSDLLPVSVTGHALAVEGQTVETVVLGDRPTKIGFIIVKNCPHPIILGWDAIMELSQKSGIVTIDVPNQKCTLGSTETPLLDQHEIGRTQKWSITDRRKVYDVGEPIVGKKVTKGQIAARFLTACVSASILLPPASICMVPIRLDGTVTNNQWVNIQGHLPENSREHFRTLHIPNFRLELTEKTQIVKIPIINVSEQPKTLRKGSEIAHIRAVKTEFENPIIKGQQAEIEKKLDHIANEDSKKLVSEFLHKNKQIFGLGKPLGRTKIVKHNIDTGQNRPVSLPAYRIPFAKREIVKEHIERMLKSNIIRPSQSPWSAPIVLTNKKDGTQRFCVDYRKLNKLTTKDAYPLPRVDDIFSQLRGSTIFSTLDLEQGYHQIELAENDKPKTAFNSFLGLYEFNVLPFGLSNGPATFQRTMERVLRELNWKNCFVYLDDILIGSSNFSTHISDLQKVFDRIATAGLTLKLAKCEFALPEVKYLGHVINKNGLSVNPEKVVAIRAMKQPNTVTEIKSFLGLASYYRRFVPQFAAKTAAINKLLQKDQLFKWSRECKKNFEDVKADLEKAATLAFPDFKKPFIIQTDASGSGIGGVLSQITNEIEQPLAYVSRTLNKAERNYSTIEREALAIVWSLKQFRPYVYGHQIKLYTDHAPIRYLKIHDAASARLVRWVMSLQEYDIEIFYKKGQENANADALSRLPRTDEKTEKSIAEDEDTNQWWKRKKENENLKINMITNTPLDWAKAQSRDTFLGPIYRLLQYNKQTKGLDAEKIKQTENFLIENRIMKYQKNTKTEPVIAVPRSRVPYILGTMHDDALAGHPGYKRTLEKIQSRFFWPQMATDTKKYCDECAKCQRRKPDTHHPTAAPMKPIPVAGAFERWIMDTMGPLPITPQGNRHILVFMDQLTKWAETVAIPDLRAETIAVALIDRIISRFGAPKELQSDRGSSFMSAMFNETCRLCRIRRINSTPYHPQTNGLVERFNRTLEIMLSMYVENRRELWDEYLSLATFAYNTSRQESTKYTPYFLVYGRQAKLPVEQAIVGGDRAHPSDEFNENVRDSLEKSRAIAQTAIRRAQAQQKIQYDRRHHVVSVDNIAYRPGQYFWLKNDRSPGKFDPRWLGPYRLVAFKPPNATISDIRRPDRHRTVHVDKIKPYAGPRPTTDDDVDVFSDDSTEL